MVVDAPEVLHRLEAVDDLDAALIRLAGVLALLLRTLPVVPEAVPVLPPPTAKNKRGEKGKECAVYYRLHVRGVW